MHKFQIHKLWVAAMLGFIGLCIVLPVKLQAQEPTNLRGVPTIIDSGTLLINGQKISLWGINALAPDQMCWQKNAAWCCGEQATLALQHFVHGTTISCDLLPQETLDKTVIKARCIRETTLRKKDLAKFLIQKGLATSATKEYNAAEKRAKIFKRGIWSGKFQTAEDWNNGIERYINK